jgi:adenosylcobinamide-GDP ribazoletransferase
LQLKQDLDPPEPPPAPPPAPNRRLGDDVVMGLRFFSRLPAGERAHEKPVLSRIAMALPFTSLLIGIGPALLLAALAWMGMPAYFAAALAVAAQVIVTGAMAEDGLADAADGLFGSSSPERRLMILKDSRHGTYGVAALCMLLVLRVTGLGAVAAVSPLAVVGVWLASTVLARSGSLWLSVALPPARTDGVSATAGRVSWPSFAVGLVLALLLGFALAAPFTSVLAVMLALLLAAIVAAVWAKLCLQLVGGQTGDLIGALQALLEIATLSAFMLFV